MTKLELLDVVDITVVDGAVVCMTYTTPMGKMYGQAFRVTEYSGSKDIVFLLEQNLHELIEKIEEDTPF
jgi:hypothetical protein